jgi:Cu(I)/Ag(I) efflux system membrane protein CusA/SilA
MVGDRRRRALVVVTVPVFTHLGSEFMPPLDEGVARLHADDDARHLDRRGENAPAGRATGDQAVPEVDRVLGKAGRADTSTDPAPLSMLETVITLKPTSEWRRVDTWYSGGRRNG